MVNPENARNQRIFWHEVLCTRKHLAKAAGESQSTLSSITATMEVPDGPWPAEKLMKKLVSMGPEVPPFDKSWCGIPIGVEVLVRRTWKSFPEVSKRFLEAMTGAHTWAVVILSDAMVPAMKFHLDLLAKAGSSWELPGRFWDVLGVLFELALWGEKEVGSLFCRLTHRNKN